MKKITFLSIAFILIAAAASAQNAGDRFRRHRIEQSFRKGELNRFEKRRLYSNELRINIARKRAARDGMITRSERRRIQMMKMNERRNFLRYRTNSRRRLI